jgi:hypothetical protein
MMTTVRRFSPTMLRRRLGSASGAGDGEAIPAGVTTLSAQDAVIPLRTRAANTLRLRTGPQPPQICCSADTI